MGGAHGGDVGIEAWDDRPLPPPAPMSWMSVPTLKAWLLEENRPSPRSSGGAMIRDSLSGHLP